MTACVAKLNRIVAREEQRTRSRMRAYHVVGRHLDRSATWVRGLIGQGIGRIDNHLSERIDELLIRGLEAEIVRLSHELCLARQGGARLDSEQISEIETHLARATALLEGKTEEKMTHDDDS